MNSKFICVICRLFDNKILPGSRGVIDILHLHILVLRESFRLLALDTIRAKSVLQLFNRTISFYTYIESVVFKGLFYLLFRLRLFNIGFFISNQYTWPYLHLAR